MTPQLREEIEEIVSRYITRESHKGSVNRVKVFLIDVIIALINREVDKAVNEQEYEIKRAKDEF